MMRHIALAALAALSLSAHGAEAWKPTKPVTIIVANAAGGTGDRTVRVIQRVVEAHKLMDLPIVIVNRPGGNGTIAMNQLAQSRGDGHVLLLISGANLSAQVAGLTPHGHTDFTPVAIIVDEYFGVNVRPDSPIASIADMLNRLRKAPDALSFGTASLTGTNFTSMAAALKKGGVDVKRVKAVGFPGGNEIAMALLGGHVDATHSGLSNVAPHVVAGKMRTIVVSGPVRMWGPFAKVPTWKEAGIDFAASSWRGMMGPKDLTPAQIVFWESLFQRVTASEEWKQDLRENYWVAAYSGAAETKRSLDAEYLEIRQIMTDLGMAKGK